MVDLRTDSRYWQIDPDLHRSFVAVSDFENCRFEIGSTIAGLACMKESTVAVEVECSFARDSSAHRIGLGRSTARRVQESAMVVDRFEDHIAD